MISAVIVDNGLFRGTTLHHTMPGMSDGSGSVLGVAPEHMLGLLAPLLIPIAVSIWLCYLRGAMAAGSVRARRYLDALESATTVDRAAIVLLLVTGFVHFGIVPAHLQAEPFTAFLFVLNGALFVMIALLAFAVRWWRGAAAVLLVATVLAYLVYLVSGREDVNQLGIATKLVELTALGLILLPRWSAAVSTLRLAGATAAVLGLTLLTGSVSWAVEFRNQNKGSVSNASMQTRSGPEAHTLPGMVMQPVPGTATPGQRAAAEKLVADTRAGIARYENVNAAVADGYRPSTAKNAPTVHYLNAAYVKDGRTLDPTRPEALVYANTKHGPVLMGAMYMMPKPGMQGPDIGGPYTDWHVHSNLCFSLLQRGGIYFASPFGTCPAGSLNVISPAMLHVWTAANPTGPFGDLDSTYLKRIVSN